MATEGVLVLRLVVVAVDLFRPCQTLVHLFAWRVCFQTHEGPRCPLSHSPKKVGKLMRSLSQGEKDAAKAEAAFGGKAEEMERGE